MDSSSPDGHRRFFSLTNENTGFLWPSDPTFALEVMNNGTGRIFGHNASGDINYVTGLTYTNITGSYTISATVSSAGYHFVSAELGLYESGAFDQPNGSFSDIFPDTSTYVSVYTQTNGSAAASPLVVDRISVEIIPEPIPLMLEVNKSTGLIRMFSDADNPADFIIDFYKILSDGGALDDTGWSSMEDQDHDGNGVPNDGIGWEEVGVISSGFLAEANLTGESLFVPEDEVNLGHAYDTTSGLEDLVFTYRLDNGTVLEGIVTYVTSSIILGDVNGDGLVNGFDVDPFVAVLLNGPYQAEADVNEDGAVNGFDVDPFVALVLGGGSAPQGAEIPEPTTLALLGLGGLAALRRRK